MSGKTPFINASTVRQYALDSAKALRPHHPFTRVSADFLERIDAAVRGIVTREIQALPSKGTTIK